MDELAKAYEEGNSISVIAGKQRNSKQLVIADLENMLRKHGNGLYITTVSEIFDTVARHYNIPSITFTSTTINNAYHKLYYINGLNGDERQNSIFKELGIELIEHKKFAVPLTHDNTIMYDNIIKEIDIGKYKNLVKMLNAIDRLVIIVKQYYQEGYRDLICLGLSGYLRKANYSLEDAKVIVYCLALALEDEEAEDRVMQCVEQTYKQALEEVASFQMIRGIDERCEKLAEELSRFFRVKGENLYEELIEFMDDILKEAKGYNAVVKALRFCLDRGDKEIQFLKDYLYVTRLSASDDGEKGNGIIGMGINGKRPTLSCSLAD